jgi:hypothetical protein
MRRAALGRCATIAGGGKIAMLKRLFSRENLLALALCLLLILLVIVTADTAPQWIYQGF